MRRAWLLLCVGCGGSTEVEIGGRLRPLESENLAPSVDGGPYPEEIRFASGAGLIDDDGEEVFWAHARAFVHADLDAVWAAAREIEVCVDRREVDDWSVERDTVAGFEHSWTIHNTVHDLLTVQYDVTWVHEAQPGAEGEPTVVVGRWDKTDGTPMIDILRGSLVLRPVAEGVVEVELIEHLKAALRDEQTLVRYLDDYYADLRAVVHGEPLPEL